MAKLHRAVMNEDLPLVKELLLSGEDVNSKDYFGMTPLHDAVSNRYIDIVEVLLDNGADVNALDDFGHTPLMKCLDLQPFYDGIDINGIIIANMLIKHNADLNIKYQGKTVCESTKNVHFRNFLLTHAQAVH